MHMHAHTAPVLYKTRASVLPVLFLHRLPGSIPVQLDNMCCHLSQPHVHSWPANRREALSLKDMPSVRLGRCCLGPPSGPVLEDVVPPELSGTLRLAATAPPILGPPVLALPPGGAATATGGVREPDARLPRPPDAMHGDRGGEGD
jgi:hypothetical protein